MVRLLWVLVSITMWFVIFEKIWLVVVTLVRFVFKLVFWSVRVVTVLLVYWLFVMYFWEWLWSMINVMMLRGIVFKWMKALSKGLVGLLVNVSTLWNWLILFVVVILLSCVCWVIGVKKLLILLGILSWYVILIISLTLLVVFVACIVILWWIVGSIMISVMVLVVWMKNVWYNKFVKSKTNVMEVSWNV